MASPSTIPVHGPAGRAGAAGQRAAPGEEGSLALRPPTAAGRHSRTTCGTNITQREGLKWSERPRCTAGVGLTATDTIASPRAEFLLGQWSKAELLLQSPVPACTLACPVPPRRGASRPQARAQLQVCGIPSWPQLCQGLHLVILFPCLGWLFTVPKQQKKAASKAKPHRQNPGQS